MNDIYVTLTGRVAAEPRQHTFGDGARVTSLRVLTSHRYFDKKTGLWADGDRVCFVVRCWRALADNVAQSIQVGHPVVVSGRLRIREFGQEGDRRFVPEVEASSVGHDLRWGVGAFSKPDRVGSVGSVSMEMRDRLDEETQDWALSPKVEALDGHQNVRVLGELPSGGSSTPDSSLTDDLDGDGPSTNGSTIHGADKSALDTDDAGRNALDTGGAGGNALGTDGAGKSSSRTGGARKNALDADGAGKSSHTGGVGKNGSHTGGAGRSGSQTDGLDADGAGDLAGDEGDNALVRVLGAAESGKEAEDAEWPVEERVAA